MIPVTPVAEPEQFDELARKPGNEWLAANPQAHRPRDYWSPFREALAQGFANRCGYSAMLEPSGTIDHFCSFHQDRTLAYEWSNYRYASSWLNSSKKTKDVLDPYEVGEGWFEVHLPSLQLRLTDKIPPEIRSRAEAMLERFPIRDDERILKQRRTWLTMYRKGKLTLDGLREVAPLIAAAVEREGRHQTNF